MRSLLQRQLVLHLPDPRGLILVPLADISQTDSDVFHDRKPGLFLRAETPLLGHAFRTDDDIPQVRRRAQLQHVKKVWIKAQNLFGPIHGVAAK